MNASKLMASARRLTAKESKITILVLAIGILSVSAIVALPSVPVSAASSKMPQPPNFMGESTLMLDGVVWRQSPEGTTWSTPYGDSYILKCNATLHEFVGQATRQPDDKGRGEHTQYNCKTYWAFDMMRMPDSTIDAYYGQIAGTSKYGFFGVINITLLGNFKAIIPFEKKSSTKFTGSFHATLDRFPNSPAFSWGDATLTHKGTEPIAVNGDW